MTFKLEDIVKTPLDTSERLDLFNEGCHIDDADKIVVDLGWPKDWKIENSMWNHRWSPDDSCDWETTKHLGWVAKKVKIRKLVASLRDGRNIGWCAANGNPIKKLQNIMEREYFPQDLYKKYTLTWELTDQRQNGYHNHTTLDFHIHRLETDKEFKHRKKAQEAYISGLIKIREKEEKQRLSNKEENEKKQLERLKKKYG